VLDELTRHGVAAWPAKLTETAAPSTVGIEIPGPPDEPVPILTDDQNAALLGTSAVDPRTSSAVAGCRGRFVVRGFVASFVGSSRRRP